jgi:hypothetical protein
MTIFRLKMDAEFVAEDIEDALRKLAAHFQRIADDEPSDLLVGGELFVGKKEKEQ